MCMYICTYMYTCPHQHRKTSETQLCFWWPDSGKSSIFPKCCLVESSRWGRASLFPRLHVSACKHSYTEDDHGFLPPLAHSLVPFPDWGVWGLDWAYLPRSILPFFLPSAMLGICGHLGSTHLLLSASQVFGDSSYGSVGCYSDYFKGRLFNSGIKSSPLKQQLSSKCWWVPQSFIQWTVRRH
jgi:hypothetical protein